MSVSRRQVVPAQFDTLRQIVHSCTMRISNLGRTEVKRCDLSLQKVVIGNREAKTPKPQSRPTAKVQT